MADLATRIIAHSVIDQLGVRASDLQASLATPTIAEYLPRVSAAASPATQHSYWTYWRCFVEDYGHRALDDIYPSDILRFHRAVIRRAQLRPNNRGGHGAGEQALRAVRNLYRLAERDGHIKPGHNPAQAVPLPRRKRSTRRGLSADEVNDITRAVAAGGTDIALDSLLVRLHLETACRRGGALALRLRDLDTTYCRVLLREKGGTRRWQPISPTLTTALTDHARRRRAANPGGSLLRYRDGRPLTSRRYDTLWARIRRSQLPWADQLGVSTHWLRHTTLTWVERSYGYAIAHTYAGHSHDKGTTLIYTRGIHRDVATALAHLTGEPHPLAGGAEPPTTAP